MSESKHAPKPWTIEGDPSSGGFYLSETGSIGTDLPLFECTAFVGTPEEWKANAEHLLLAVNAHDDLVFALKNIIDSIEVNDDRAVNIALAAIAKAEGQS